jgi:hypothetical protein
MITSDVPLRDPIEYMHQHPELLHDLAPGGTRIIDGLDLIVRATRALPTAFVANNRLTDIAYPSASFGSLLPVGRAAVKDKKFGADYYSLNWYASARQIGSVMSAAGVVPGVDFFAPTNCEQFNIFRSPFVVSGLKNGNYYMATDSHPQKRHAASNFTHDRDDHLVGVLAMPPAFKANILSRALYITPPMTRLARIFSSHAKKHCDNIADDLDAGTGVLSTVLANVEHNLPVAPYNWELLGRYFVVPDNRNKNLSQEQIEQHGHIARGVVTKHLQSLLPRIQAVRDDAKLTIDY